MSIFRLKSGSVPESRRWRGILFSFDCVCEALNIAPEILRDRLGGFTLGRGAIRTHGPRIYEPQLLFAKSGGLGTYARQWLVKLEHFSSNQNVYFPSVPPPGEGLLSCAPSKLHYIRPHPRGPKTNDLSGVNYQPFRPDLLSPRQGHGVVLPHALDRV
jgi:hypothetical protein